jgi:hypothetical protein
MSKAIVKQLVDMAYRDGVPWMDDFWLSVPRIETSKAFNL